jgi:Tol biopolymer transport system component
VGEHDSLHIAGFPNGDAVASFETIPAAILNIGARWTPDGQAVAYIARAKGAGNIWLQRIDGTPPRQLTNFTSGEIYNFAFSSDGKTLILARGYPNRDVVLIKASMPATKG